MLAMPGDSDVTVDIQMMSAARGSQITVANDGALETKLVSTPSISKVGVGKNSVGVRPHLADITRNVTASWNANPSNPWGQLEPREVQAIIWSEWKLQQGTLEE